MLTFLTDTAAAAGTGVNSLTSILIPIIIGGIIGLLIYFIPSVLAFKNKKINKTAILVLNIFLGWSIIGWVVALVWAVSKDKTTTI